MKRILLASTFMFAVAGSALAADAVAYEPAPEAAPTGFVWTGGYVGLQAGYAWANSHYSNRSYSDFADYDPKGAFGGIYGGYNYQFANNVVLGIDADINYSAIDSETKFYWWGVDPRDGASAEMKWAGAGRVRLGYAMDRLLPYVAGGVAIADYRINLDTHFSRKDTLTGWTLGGGLEYAATDNILLRAEYRYSDYGRENWSGWTADEELDLRTNDLRLGVAYKF